jgi:hypothetical protein
MGAYRCLRTHGRFLNKIDATSCFGDGFALLCRDALNINAEGGGGVLDENVHMQKAKENLLKQHLRMSLKALPAPKNEYEINFAGALPEGGERTPVMQYVWLRMHYFCETR